MNFPAKITADSDDMITELVQIEELAERLSSKARVKIHTHLPHGKKNLPIHSFSFGSDDPKAPVLGLIGGVHGLERIGTHVCLAFLNRLSESLDWDEALNWKLKQSKIVIMPLVNPVGMSIHRRSNGNSVDIMRNSPVIADHDTPVLLGGQRISRWMPWYMGGPEMEKETQVLCDFVREEVFSAQAALVIDVHSGFGLRDRLWFPYAKSKKPLPHISEIYSLRTLMDRVYPNHVYVFEPQSKNYTTHGDVWDYLYDEHLAKNAASATNRVFLPLTLELGSWNWIRKNPRQLFSFLGPFNPMSPHRHKRTLRRHLPLFDFLLTALISSKKWCHLSDDEKQSQMVAALELWF